MRAKAILEADDYAQVFEFEELSVNADAPEVEIVLTNRQGQRLLLTLSRADLKSLVSMRLLLSL